MAWNVWSIEDFATCYTIVISKQHFLIDLGGYPATSGKLILYLLSNDLINFWLYFCEKYETYEHV